MVIVQITVPQNHWPSSTCSWDDNGGGGSADNGTLALSVIPLSLARSRNNCGGGRLDDGASASLAVHHSLMR
jgi:hypothetical protein